MRNPVSAGTTHSPRARRLRLCGAILALITLPLAMTTGCGDEVSKEFREAALGSIETGLNSIVDGVLDGFFAVAEPDTTTTSTTTGSSSSSSSSSSSGS